MTIKQVSEKYQVSEDTLRYYEKIGVLRPVPRKNGIRCYGQKELDNIEFVLCMRAAGLSVETLERYMQLFEMGDSTAEQRRQILIDQRNSLVKKLEQMQEALKRLDYKIDVYYTEILDKERKMLRKGDEK